jgi:broad specificity phosphatase PhoE
MITFYIARHGQTELNAKGVTQGHIDSPLTQAGMQNTLITAQKIKSKQIDLVVTSDLGRAFRTGFMIRNILNLSCDIEVSKEIREIDFGEYNYRSEDWVREEVFWFRQYPDKTYPEGESFEQMQIRVINYLSQLEKIYVGKNLLIVCHGGVIVSVIHHFLKQDLAEIISPDNEYCAELVLDEGQLKSFTKL